MLKLRFALIKELFTTWIYFKLKIQREMKELEQERKETRQGPSCNL
jgi:hypothetical protein